MFSANLTNNLTNLITSSILTITSETVEVVDTSFVSTVLTLLIVLSLTLTFHTGGTSVHKVLGLLMVSIFVVFLWMFQTQFLFIYIVYIMAFISAVLMLFLSVVLMLPISTLTPASSTIGRRQESRLMVPTIMLTVELPELSTFNPMPDLVSAGITSALLVVVMYIISNCSIRNFKINTRHRTDGWTSFCLDLMSRILRLVQLRSEGATKAHTVNSPILLTLDRKQAILNYLVVLVFVLIFSATELLRSLAGVVMLATRYIRTCLVSFISALRPLLESLLQTYLYFLATISYFALLKAKQEWFCKVINQLSIEGSLGLGQIKELLYGPQSYLLIFSTIVLLVALLGAAVMTRNKR